jgi:histidinol-phosphate/aromatic aminotransferase/cobyric acid decarboxylase-like protein
LIGKLVHFGSIFYIMPTNADWLEKVLKGNGPIPKLVTVVNPGNPSGAFIPKPMLQVISLSLLPHSLTQALLSAFTHPNRELVLTIS